MEKKRKLQRLFLGAAITLTVVGGALLIALTTLFSPVNTAGQVEIFEIQAGWTTKDVARNLEQEGLIRKQAIFEVLCRYHKVDARLQAGQYELSSAMSLQEITDAILAGPRIEMIPVTIPEGYTVPQIVEALVHKNLGESSDFYQEIERISVDDYSFLEGVPANSDAVANRLEGFLFPDTYFFDAHLTPRQILCLFLDRFGQEVTDETRTRLQERNMSIYEWVIKASIVEREVANPKERDIVAGVFENRLRIGQNLESCATVQFILKENKPVLSIADTQIDSPYNTYKYAGLPPGPIANPGHAALYAALYPTDTPYFFFVAKPDGSHAFAETYRQHLANVAKYQN